MSVNDKDIKKYDNQVCLLKLLSLDELKCTDNVVLQKLDSEIRKLRH